MDANGWAVIIGAIGLILTQLATMVLAFKREQASIARGKVATDKLDENTRLTKTGTAVAATAATAAKQAAEGLAKQLNGELDARIKAAVESGTAELLAELAKHTQQDEANFTALRAMLKEK